VAAARAVAAARVVGAALLASLAWILFAAVSEVHAAPPSFGPPKIEGSFGQNVVATQPVTLDAAPDRVEILQTIADSPAPLVADVPPPAGGGSASLRYTVAPPNGPFLPNTPVRVRWRITADGVTTLGPEVRTVIADERFTWQTISGDIVRVHWYEGDHAFGEHALAIGERAVTDTAKLLGVTEDKPVDFFIYADQGAFYDALGPGTRENVGGQANADIRTLFAHIPPSSIDDPWVENVVPHELVHLVFDTAVKNPYHFPPRWLNEGLAVYLSVGYGPGDRSSVESAGRDGELIPLTGLGGQFPTAADRFGLAYSESVSAVDFFIREHGRDALIGLIRSYADGRSDDEAFDAAIDQDVEAFDEAWRADVGAVEPTSFGPRAAPPGPLPQAWGGTGAPIETGSEALADLPVRTLGLVAIVLVLGATAAVLVVRGGALPWRGRRSAPGP
jgi:hypothetical protein